jgi:hypothetical protein
MSSADVIISSSTESVNVSKSIDVDLAELLTISQVHRFRVRSSFYECELDFLEVLALDACPSLEALLGLGKLFALDCISFRHVS